MKDLDFGFLVPYIPQLVQASKLTFAIGVLSFGAALLIAVCVGILRSGNLPRTLDGLIGAIYFCMTWSVALISKQLERGTSKWTP